MPRDLEQGILKTLLSEIGSNVAGYAEPGSIMRIANA